MVARDEELARHLATDYRGAGLSEQDGAMLAYVAKLTQTPGAVTEEDVETLRDHDFDDRAILDIAVMTGLFAYLNRLASGLGVELEDVYNDFKQ